MAGPVQMRLRGVMIEQFIRRAVEDGARLGEVRRTGAQEIRFSASPKDARKLLGLAQRYRQDLTVTGLRGISRLGAWLRSRPALVPALIMSLVSTWLCLSRVWIIECPAEVKEALGIRPGALIENINTRALEAQLLAQFPEYAFVGARLSGVRLSIKAVKERPQPAVYDASGARDLYADSDAVIERIDALAGKAVAQAGDVVRRGQLLIRGEEQVTDDYARGVCALGSAIGRSWITGHAQGALRIESQQRTGRRSREARLVCPWLEVPIERGHRFESAETEAESLPIGGLFVPLRIERQTHHETKPVRIEGDEARLSAKLCGEAMENALAGVPPNAEIVDKWTDYSMIEGELIRARAAVEIRRNIAASKGAPPIGGN